jgi:hypothetical protein
LHFIDPDNTVGDERHGEFAFILTRGYDSHGTSHPGDALHNEIDLFQLDSIATNLNLIIATTIKPQPAFLVFMYQVTRAIANRPVPVLLRILAEARGGLFWFGVVTKAYAGATNP